jgi:2-dehydro-3-deoxyglucarate aldolase
MIIEHTIQINAMPVNTIKKRMQEAKPVFGSWLTIPHSMTVEIMASAGYDWLIVDFEHAPIDIQNGLAMIQAMRYSPVSPVARVPLIDMGWIKRVLDIGFFSVMVPLIRTGEETEYAVKLANYPPRGIRGAAAATRATGYGTYTKEYLARANQETMVIIQIENPDSVANIKDIVSVPGVDCLFIGPMDLSVNLGVPGDFQHPRMLEAFRKVEDAAREASVPLGTLVGTPEDAKKKVDEGYLFLGISSDANHMARGARGDGERIAQMRKTLQAGS